MRSRGKFDPLDPLRHQVKFLVRGYDGQAALSQVITNKLARKLYRSIVERRQNFVE